jgi:hypothetical protein
LGEGCHKVGDATVIIARDGEEGCYSVDTEGDYFEFYCEMVKDDMACEKEALDELWEERDGLKVELFRLIAQKKDAYTIESVEERIAQLSKQIQKVANPPDYKQWWAEVQEEIAIIRHQQEQVKQALAKNEPLRKSKALRQLIGRIVIEWGTEPTKDRRHKGGVRTFCKSVRVIGTDGNETHILSKDALLA